MPHPSLQPAHSDRHEPLLLLLAVLSLGFIARQEWDEPDENPEGTTVERTIRVSGDAAADTYQHLEYLPGWPVVVRQDMTAANPERLRQRRSLVSFVHLTDMHITDAQSPTRNPFARKFGIDFRTDFRNQEALTLHVDDSMVQRIACVSQVFNPAPLFRPNPPNPDRAQYLTEDFLRLHFESPTTPGPVGHGLTEQNVLDETLYYSFDMAPEVVGIMLDTVNQSGQDGGSIASLQAAWFEQQLQANSSQYFATRAAPSSPRAIRTS